MTTVWRSCRATSRADPRFTLTGWCRPTGCRTAWWGRHGADNAQTRRRPGNDLCPEGGEMANDRADALVIFGATGDLAKLETFPALVGLVERGALDVPVIGVGMSGWALPEFREYAADSLKHNGIEPSGPAASRMLDLLDYVDGDLTID